MTGKSKYKELIDRLKELESLVDVQAAERRIRELEASESRFRALTEASQEGIFIHDQGYCIEVNSVGCTMFGYEPGGLLGKHASLVFTRESWPMVEANITGAANFSYEAVGVRKDGSTFNVEITGKNYFYNGKEVRVASVRDITERVRVEKALRNSESKFREVFENAGDGILIGDLNGAIVEVNKAFLNMSGFSKDELIGKNIRILFSADSMEDKPLRYDVLDKGSNIIMERLIIGKNGKPIPVEMNSKRPHAEYYISILRDLRERRKAAAALERKNKELIRAKEKAEESDRLKSSFLANMSHEIRTPMNGILGFAELIRAEDEDVKLRREYLDVVVSSGHQLLDIINDVLEISRIETGQVSINNGIVNIDAMLREMRLFFQPLSRHNHNDLELVLPENTEDLRVHCDSSKIRQVLTNLINNALKFTLNGEVRYGYALNSDDDIEFFVKDNGIGIAADFKERVFERFLQVESGGQTKYRGAGLGLAICKHLVELMDGSIWVDSVENEGACFYFTVPLKKAEPA